MQQHYRAYAQQQGAQRSPHGQNQRRGGIGPMMGAGAHGAAQPTQAQIAQQQQAQMQANELAKRRSRKPTDKSIPDGVEEHIVNPDAVQRYKELRDLERLLDSTITRKRLDVLESAQRPSKQHRTLRVWISNTVEDQAWQGNGLSVDAFDFTPAMEASYRVKIEGRLLDDDEQTGANKDDAYKSASEAKTADENSADKMEEDAPAKEAKPEAQTQSRKFSHFFRSISVEFDRSRFRNGTEQTIEWKKAEPNARNANAGPQADAAEFDEFTFKRNGDENVNITVNLFRQQVPERYQLSPELAEVVDMTEATQQEAVMALWEYIRASGLQEDEEKRNFRCDEPLRKVVGRGDVGYIPMLNEYVTAHVRPLPPVSLPYTIRVDEEFHKSPEPTIYDIQVPIEDPWRGTLQTIMNNPQYAAMLREITSMDDQLARIVQAVAVSKARHSFLDSLAESPAKFVNNWLSSQKRDLEIIMGDSTNGETTTGDEWRRGGSNSVWATQNARESVNVLLARQR